MGECGPFVYLFILESKLVFSRRGLKTKAALSPAMKVLFKFHPTFKLGGTGPSILGELKQW